MNDLKPLAVTVVMTAALIAAPAAARAACDGSPLQAGPKTIPVGGTARSFVVRPPSGYEGRTPAPVVFVFHPFGTNAQYMLARVSISRAWPDAVGIYPEGMPRGPAPGGLAWQGRQGEMEDRDLRFFDAMLAWLDERACIDHSRVFVLGYSNGAGFAHLLACERSDRIAGAAIAAGRLGCTPTQATPVVMSHGTADMTIGYDQAVDAARTWSQINGCQAPPATAVPGCVAAEACSGAPLTMCTHAGGHGYDQSFTATAVDFLRSVRPRSR